MMLVDANLLLYAYHPRSKEHEAQATGPLVMDAALAALAIEHGATLQTTDKEFARFSGLKWVNPLTS